jgi:hypothetical protein
VRPEVYIANVTERLVEGLSLKKIRIMVETHYERSDKTYWKEKDLGAMYTSGA